jgi:hypothetical protein
MTLKYYYSIFANIIFFVFGFILFSFGLDQLYFKTEVVANLLNNFEISGSNTQLGLWIMVFLGTLLTTGFLVNLIKGKNYVIEASEDGLVIHTGSIKTDSSKINIKWNDFIETKTEYRSGSFRGYGENRGRTKVLVILIKKNKVEWPSVMITRNKISFQREEDFDKIIINAWLNKKKSTIVNELNRLASNCKNASV